jgi:hypothetical protein
VGSVEHKLSTVVKVKVTLCRVWIEIFFREQRKLQGFLSVFGSAVSLKIIDLRRMKLVTSYYYVA